MADDKNFETNSKSATSSSRKRASGSASGRTSGSSNDLDLAGAESRAEADGFNHPHLATTELNAESDVDTDSKTAGSLDVTSNLSSMASNAASKVSGVAGSFSREDLMNNFNTIKDSAKDYAGKAGEKLSAARKQAGEFAKKFEDVPAAGREVFNRVDTSTRANPWLSIAVTGVGALALGFLAGRLFAGASVAVGEAAGGYDFDQATDE